MLTDLSLSQVNFDENFKMDNRLIAKANQLTLSDFNFIDQLSAYRTTEGVNKYYVLLNPPYCSCIYFLEFGICKHFISLCKLPTYTTIS